MSDFNKLEDFELQLAFKHTEIAWSTSKDFVASGVDGKHRQDEHSER